MTDGVSPQFLAGTSPTALGQDRDRSLSEGAPPGIISPPSKIRLPVPGARPGADAIDLEAEIAAAQAYGRAAWAESTRDVYSRRNAHFVEWCRERGVDPLPAAPETVAVYLAFVAKAGATPSTVYGRLAAIRHSHVIAGHHPPMAPGLSAVVAGIRRTKGMAPRRVAKPIGLADLGKAVAACIVPPEPDRELLDRIARAVLAGEPPPALPDGHVPDPRRRRAARLAALRDRAIFLLGWGGALRRSEIAALDVKDVLVDTATGGMEIRIRRGKTDQDGRGQWVHVLPAPGPADPARAVAAWRGEAAIEEGPLFRAVAAHGLVGPRALSAKGIGRIIKFRARQAGIDGDASGHSLRAGFITAVADAAAARGEGVDLVALARHARHRSITTTSRYVRRGDSYQHHPARRLHDPPKLPE